MAKLSVEIVTAERQLLVEDNVDMVVAPGSQGVVGILPKHAPLLTTLLPGAIRIKKDGSETAMAVGGGFLQVAGDRVLVLADTCEREDEIDATRAEAARQRAEEALREAAKSGMPVQVEAARSAYHRSVARLNVVRRRRPNRLG